MSSNELSQLGEERGSMTDYLDKVPLRDNIFAGVGSALYLAASPDEFDGLSDAEYELFRTRGVDAFNVFEKLGRVGAPESLRLPEGFTQHFKDEVLADLEIIRKDPAKREEYRAAIRGILDNPSQLNQLYRGGGLTYSGLTSRIAGTHRSGKFYEEERRLLPHPHKQKGVPHGSTPHGKEGARRR